MLYARRFILSAGGLVTMLGVLWGVYTASAAVQLPAGARSATALPHTDKPLPARHAQFVQNTWGSREGLLSLPHRVWQTRDGYLWIGTEEGLLRFDGGKFVPYEDRSLFASRNLKSQVLYETRDGSLWYGTKGGLNRLQNGVFTAYTTQEGLAHNHVLSLCEDQQGVLWIGTRKGLSQWKQGRLMAFPAFAEQSITALLAARDGSLWVGTRNGLHRVLDGQSTGIRRPYGWPNDAVTALLEDRQGSLWVGLRHGLWELRHGQWTKHDLTAQLHGDAVVALAEDSQARLWIATETSLGYRAQGQFHLQQQLPSDAEQSYHDLITDREGSVWVAQTEGLLQLHEAKFRSLGRAEGLPFENTSLMLQTRDGSLWTDAGNSGIARLKDQRITVYRAHNGFTDAEVRALSEGPDGSLWIGTRQGLYRHRAERFELVAAQHPWLAQNISALQTDPGGGLWIGVEDHGLLSWRGSTFTLYSTENGLSGNRLTAIACARDGSVWLGTYDAGISRLKDGQFTHYTTQHGLTVNFVRTILEDRDGQIWVGLNGGGVSRFQHNRFTSYTVKEGLADDQVPHLLEDKQGHLWMTSFRGVSYLQKQQFDAFDQKQISLLQPTVFGAADGIKGCNGGSQPGGWRAQDGTLWFPGSGFTMIDPGQIGTNPVPPPVKIETLFVDRQPFTGTEFTLNPGSHDLEVHYTGLSLVEPTKVRFKYKLQGYDHDWIEAGTRRVAYYTNLPPGTYLFRVVACNNDGVWNETGATLQLRLEPHLYQTPSFYTLCAIATSVLLLGAYKLRVRNLKQRKLELERQVEQQTSALRQKQVELEEQKTFLRKVIDVIPSFIFVKDRESRFLLANQALAQSYGTTVDDIIGKTDADFNVHPEQVEKFRLDDLEVMDFNAEKFTIETFTGVNGEPRWVQVNKLPVCAEDGTVQGLVGVATDITLQQMIAAELQRAKEAAEAATRAKSEFLANMSHEIRTPMNAVIGMTGLLLDTPLSHEQREFVEIVRTSGDALLTIINDILDFSKIESGKLDLEEQPFCLTDCIEETLDLLAAKASEKGLDLAYLLDEKTPHTLLGDITRLRQVLVNLVSNAIKFTARGEVVISVTSRLLSEPAGEPRYELQFAVKDTGIGIPPDRMDRLFRSFSQVDSSTTRNFGGTGLGLAISKRLSELMGGTMWVESQEGVGSTFFFTIQVTAAPTPQRLYLNGEQPQLAGKRLLIVDDNETNRRILTRQTESWGMVPEACASAAEALTRLRAKADFEIAILDWHMPEQDGVSLAQEILRAPATSNLPLVMLSSGAVSRQTIEQEANVNFAAFLSKPLKPSQLFDVLIQVFSGQRQQVKPNTAPRLDQGLAERLPLRLLLVEDNAVNQKVALRILQQMGYRADVAGNGLEALAALRRQTYDLVLMDVHMPEMDGLATTRAICSEWAADRPKIVAMTANAMEEDRKECLAAGMDGYISKPIRVEELQAVLVHWGQSLARRPAAVSHPLPRLQELIAAGELEFVLELMDLFFQTATTEMNTLREAIVQAQPNAVAFAAHSLKGTSSALGAQTFTALCEEIEQLGRHADLRTAHERLAALEAEFARVCAEIEALRPPALD